jgi:hypothetical protein
VKKHKNNSELVTLLFVWSIQANTDGGNSECQLCVNSILPTFYAYLSLSCYCDLLNLMAQLKDYFHLFMISVFHCNVILMWHMWHRFKLLTSNYLRSLPMFVSQYLYSEPWFIFFTVRRVTSYVHIIYLNFKHFYHLSYLIRCDTEVKTSALKQLIFNITSHMEVKLTLIWMCNTCKFHIR